MEMSEEFKHVRCLSYGIGKVVRSDGEIAVEISCKGDLPLDFLADAAGVAYIRYKKYPLDGESRVIRGLTEEEIFRRGFNWKESPVSQSERNFSHLSDDLQRAIASIDELYYAGQKARGELEDRVGGMIEFPTWRPLSDR